MVSVAEVTKKTLKEAFMDHKVTVRSKYKQNPRPSKISSKKLWKKYGRL